MTFKFTNTKVTTFFFSSAVVEDRVLYFEPAQLKAEYHDCWDKIPFSQRLLFSDHTANKEPK